MSLPRRSRLSHQRSQSRGTRHGRGMLLERGWGSPQGLASRGPAVAKALVEDQGATREQGLPQSIRLPRLPCPRG